MIIRNKYYRQPVRRFQDGGAMPAEGAPMEEAPMGPEGGAPEGGGDPMMQLIQVAAQALQEQNCEAAMAVCQALVQLAQGGAGGPAPEEAPAEEPTFAKRGGRLMRVRR